MGLVVSLLLIGLVIIFSFHLALPVLPSYFYQTLALLFIGTIGIYFYLLDAKKNRPEFFVQLYILTQFVKILGYGIYMLFVVWDQPERAGDHVLVFMVSYFIFTAAEIIFLYRKVSK